MSKARFLDILRSERARWEALLAERGVAAMERPGVAGDWSLKDVIAHVTAYERGLVEWLEAARQGEVRVFADLDHPDVDYRNALILERSRNQTLEAVLAEAESVFERLMELASGLAEEDLLEPERTAWFVMPRWKTERALWECIADDSYKHYRQHRADIGGWLARREGERAVGD